MIKSILFLLIVCISTSALAASYSCDPKLQRCLARIQQLPEARHLLNKVQQEGAVHFSVAANSVTQKFGACWDLVNRVIYVNLSFSHSEGELISSIIFELHNALTTSEFDRLDQLAASGKINREDYVQAVEKIEYQNSINASRLAAKGIRQGIFPANAQLPVYRDFNEHFYYQRVGGHSAVIARNYALIAPQKK